MSEEASTIKEYASDFDTKLTVSGTQLFSYARNVRDPIYFRHYKHSHTDVGIYNFPHFVTLKDRCTLFLFRDVSFQILTERNLYTPRCGDALTVAFGEPYNVYFYGSQILNYYQIDFPKEYFEKAAAAEVLTVPFTDRLPGEDNRISLSQEEQAQMFSHLHAMEAAIGNMPQSDSLLYAHLVQILHILCNRFSSGGQKQLGDRLTPVLKQAVQYISENYLSIKSTAEIARHCHISTSYLCRIFREHLHASPVDFVNENKLSYAKYLLQNGRNVTEACYDAGFNSYNYFITLFKEKNGMTPGEYRKDKGEPSTQ